MKPFQQVVLCLLAFGCFFRCLSLNAQVTNFSVFKVTVYAQTSPTPPTTPDTPNAYYFGAQFNTLNSSDYVDIYVSGPELINFLTPNSPFYYNYGSPYYPDKLSYDADYPSGEYDFYVDHADFTEFGSVTVPDQELYATNIAAFTPACWQAMQSVDPSKNLVLQWNSFTPSPDTTTAYTFVDVLDQDSGSEPFGADFLTPDTTTTNIPAGTLLYGLTYRVNTFFSSRQDMKNAGFGGALGTVGFDNLTYTTLVTIPPPLRISALGTNAILNWPLVASNFVLQTTSQLLPADWSTVTNVPVVSGGTNFLTWPALGPTRFFRLMSVPGF